MITNAKPIGNIILLFFISVFVMSCTGCVKVSDLVNQIPALFFTSYAVTYASFIRKRITPVFLSVVSGFCVVLVIYFSVERISEALGQAIANYLTYFLIQIIPFLLYSWLVALGLVAVRKRYPEKISGLNDALLAVIPSGVVLVIYLGFLFSGFCYDCYISNTFQFVFGWPFNLLDLIK